MLSDSTVVACRRTATSTVVKEHFECFSLTMKERTGINLLRKIWQIFVQKIVQSAKAIDERLRCSYQ